MEIFRRQAVSCAPYREYMAAIGVDPASVGGVDEIPFLPIGLFKNRRVYCGDGEPEAVFTSSSTTGEGVSRHYVSRLEDYRKVYTRGFGMFYGAPFSDANPAGPKIFALLPGYLEREGSSLIEMARGLGAGFYLRDHAGLLRDMRSHAGPKILLGVSYALLDLAENFASGRAIATGSRAVPSAGNSTGTGREFPPNTVVMETGGMKGRRKEISKSQMHSVLCSAFGVEKIHSEYGMAELMSQAYSAGDGLFRTPPWMRTLVRDPRDPFDVRREGRGGLNVIDLANVDSCAFVQTDDLSTVAPDGNFTVEGRIERSDIRGCNLLVQ